MNTKQIIWSLVLGVLFLSYMLYVEIDKSKDKISDQIHIVQQTKKDLLGIQKESLDKQQEIDSIQEVNKVLLFSIDSLECSINDKETKLKNHIKTKNEKVNIIYNAVGDSIIISVLSKHHVRNVRTIKDR